MRARRAGVCVVALVLALTTAASAGEGEARRRNRLLLLGPDGQALRAVRLTECEERRAGRWVFSPELPSRPATLVRGLLEPVPGTDDRAAVAWGNGTAATLLVTAPGAVGLRLASAARLEGRLRFDRGDPAAGLEILAVPVGLKGLAHQSTTDETGAWTLPWLAPGRWEVFVRRGDGRRQSLGVFEAGDVRAEAVLEAGCRVTGRILDGDANRVAGVPGLSLFLSRLPREAADADVEPPTVATDETGRFVLTDVPSGIYEARLVDEGWFFDPEPPRLDVPFRGNLRAGRCFAVRVCKVTGRVTGPKRRPIAGAVVHLVVDPTRPTPVAGWPLVVPVRTDAEGRFELVGLRPGSGYRLAVTARGFAGQVTEPFEVVSPSDTSVPTVRLGLGWCVEVRVRAPGGAPLEGVRVRAVPARHPAAAGSALDRVLGRTGHTNAAGRVVLADLPDDDVRVDASIEGRTSASGVVRVPASGDVRTWSATLYRAPDLNGEVVSPDARPLGALVIEAAPRDGGEVREARVATDGSFAFEGLSDVPHDLAVVRAAERNAPALAHLEGVLPGTGDDVRVVLPPLLALSGRVLDLDPDGVRASLVLEAPLFDADDEVYRWRTVLERPLEEGELRTDWVLEGLAPGTYAVRAVQGANDTGAVTVRLEDEDVEVVDLVLPAAGRVAGTVLGERDLPVLGVQVDLVRLRGDGDAPGRPDGPLRRATDDEGAFVFEDVAPGLWRVQANDGEQAPDQEVVRVTSGEHVLVRDLVVGRGGTLEGRVTDGDGRELDGALLLLDSTEEGVGERRVLTGQDGIFHVEGLRPGVWRLTLVARAGPLTDLEILVEVAAGETTSVEVTAPGRGQIEGRVMRRGRPVPDVPLRLYSAAGVLGSGGRRFVARTGGDGRFAWDGLSPGSYEVDVVDGGVRATWRVPLDEGDTVRLDLEAWEGRIAGEVLTRAGDEVAGATVVAHPQVPGMPGLVGRVQTDPEGRFVIVGLPPGAYDLSVSGPGLPPGRLLGVLAEPLGAERFVSITLGRGGTLDLAVRTEEGRGVRGARVWLETENGTALNRRPYALAPSGRLRVVGVPPGWVWVRTYAPGYGRPHRARVMIREGEETQLEVVVRPGSRLRVEVVGQWLDPRPRTRVDLLRLPELEPVEVRRRLGRTRLAAPWGVLPRTGVVTFEDLGPGDYLLRVNAGDAFEPIEVRVRATPGDEVQVQIELVPRTHDPVRPEVDEPGSR